MQSDGKPIWHYMLPKCDKCGSTNVKELNIYRLSYKEKREVTKYECKECGNIFWD